jgi:hypothetical protein
MYYTKGDPVSSINSNTGKCKRCGKNTCHVESNERNGESFGHCTECHFDFEIKLVNIDNPDNQHIIEMIENAIKTNYFNDIISYLGIDMDDMSQEEIREYFVESLKCKDIHFYSEN